MSEYSPEFRELLPKLQRLCCLAGAAIYLSSIITAILVWRNKEWHEHLHSLVLRAWNIFVAQDIGSTSRGVINASIEGVSVFLLVAGMTAYLFGWKKFGDHIIETVTSVILVGGTVTLIVFGTQFVWEMVSVVYGDHTRLASANKDLQVNASHLVDPTSRDAEISDLRRELAETKSTYKTIKNPESPSTPASVKIIYQKQMPSADPDMQYGLEVLVTTDRDISPFALNLIFSGDIGRFMASRPYGEHYEEQGGIRVASPRIAFMQRRSPGFTPDSPIKIWVYSKTAIKLIKIESLPFSFPLPEGSLRN